MNFALVSLVFLLIGAAVYGAIIFWSGTRRMWWLAVLLSLPAVMGGVMSLLVGDMSASSSPIFRNFGWVVIGQLVFGILMYRLGMSKAPQDIDKDTFE